MVNVEESQVTADDRQRAKAVNFGFVFGMGAETFVVRALADYNASFTVAEARRFREIYLRTYRGVARWQGEIRQRMPLELRTASGRIREFRDKKTGYCERLNTPIQGTAADGMKSALVLLRQRLPPLGAQLVLCVHDEVLVEAPIDRAGEVEIVVKEAMIEGMQRYVKSVPIIVESSIRSTWAREGK